MDKQAIDAVLRKIQGADSGQPASRVQQIVNRIVHDLFHTIEDFDVQPEEFWSAMAYLTDAGRNGEYGLIAAGLGLEHFLDLRSDEAEARAGVTGGTPRTIEGPLYVAGAPEENGFARLDQDPQEGDVLFMQGQVRDMDGKPVAHALVEVWHANHLGGYSFFDPSQSPFNLRRSIRTDADGRYRFRSRVPVGYSVPPGGSTDQLMKLLGRHGTRPAHIHFFISAPGMRKLTTQINIEGDPFLWDDFAFATRDGLVPALKQVTDAAAIRSNELDAPFYSIDFDFTMHREQADLPKAEVDRVHFAP
ncbi:catechol 1,2-dioxygenase [Herbaspirillum sp. YR522]|uniref:catechol 1,2-dioxygenase n=1 Tax=Herbaspirillum sp. YR522 TaxID=1144342 RepID=UPI00026FBCAB|nr:catechol 1,2-dioxygenase [Herbaspirillum sp. YR522]EJM95746.1 catechol 1,2-dioxygenase, proteobacterial [Herbaspirillum sp. YR522]